MLLGLLLVLCIVRLWLMPLGESFWTDEAGTVFVVHHGTEDPTLAVAPQVAESIYFALPWIAEKLGGGSELVYRLPSTCAMLAALFVIFRLARRLMPPQAAWFVLFACLAMRGFDIQADDARPYALGTLVAVSTVWFLVRWLDAGRWRDALLFVAGGALLWRVQLIYWPFYLVLALYAGARIVMHHSAVRWPWPTAAFLALALFVWPAVPEARALAMSTQQHVIVAMPTMRSLLSAWAPAVLIALSVLLIAWPVRWIRLRKGESAAPSSWVLMAAWWLIPPLALFSFSKLTGQSVFASRYYSLMFPGAALAGTALAARYIDARRWTVLGAILGGGVLIFLGQWDRPAPRDFNYDWRAAAQAEKQDAQAATPVICVSPFVEAQSPAWHPNYPSSSFLYAPFVVYPVQGRVYTFPFDISQAAKTYAYSLTGTTLGPAGEFLLYGYRPAEERWQQWFQKRLAPRGWRSRSLGNFGEVNLVEFKARHS